MKNEIGMFYHGEERKVIKKQKSLIWNNKYRQVFIIKETDWWEVKEKDRNTIKKELGDKIMFESYEKITKRAKIIL